MVKHGLLVLLADPTKVTQESAAAGHHGGEGDLEEKETEDHRQKLNTINVNSQNKIPVTLIHIIKNKKNKQKKHRPFF